MWFRYDYQLEEVKAGLDDDSTSLAFRRVELALAHLRKYKAVVFVDPTVAGAHPTWVGAQAGVWDSLCLVGVRDPLPS